MIRTKVWILLGVLAIGGVNCGGGGPPTPGFTPPPPSQVWILAPQEDDVLPVSQAYLIRFQGASFTGIQQFEVKTSDGEAWYVGPQSTESGGANYGTMFYGEATWIPDSPGDYTIRVRATNAALLSSPWAEVQVHVGKYVAVQEAIDTPAVLEAAPSPTPTTAPWQAMAVMNANCRAGPGTAYNENGYVLKGDTLEIVGRNEDGTWLNLVNLHGEGFCWASIIAFDVPFDVNPLPVVLAPTAPPSSGQGNEEETRPQGCTVTSPLNNQTRCVSPCPPRAVPGEACTP